MRILLTGVAGLVGAALAPRLAVDHEVTGTIRDRPGPPGVATERVDLADGPATAAVVEELRPDLVVHAAYARADLDRDVVAATESVARAGAAVGAALVVLSTDSVFGGDRPPYAEAERPAPVGDYGRAKAAAEAISRSVDPAVSVVRLALVTHLDPDRPDPSTRRLLEAEAGSAPVTVFTDEIRSAVRLEDVVDGLARLVATDPGRRAGVWHLGGPRPMSRAELARVSAGALGLHRVRLRPGRAADHPEPRPRDVTLLSGRARAQLGWRPEPPGRVTGHGRPD